MNSIVTTSPGLSTQEFELFQAYIERESGISLDSGKTYLLESRLKGLVAEQNCRSFGELYHKVKLEQAPLLRNKIIDAITTNETLWFRDMGPYVVLQDVFLPEMLRQVSRGKPRVRIWSAACSTGQEPYSIAMIIHEFCLKSGEGVLNPSHFEILATDISSEALAAAKLGAYDGLSMNRGMTEDYQRKYFKQNQKFWIVDPTLKRIIDYRSFNLQSDFTGLGIFDVIFCRNVAIYFAQDFKLKLFEKMKASLRPTGLFFLGSSETLTYFFSGFQSKEYNNYAYYQA